MYLPSTDVSIFPLSKPRSADSNHDSDRLFTEHNISNMIYKLFDKDSFIIDYSIPDPVRAPSGSSAEHQFRATVSIHGYRVEFSHKFSDSDTDFKSGTYIIAKLNYDNSSNEIKGQDNGSIYNGFELKLQKNIDNIKSDPYALIVAYVAGNPNTSISGNKIVIYGESLVKMLPESFRISVSSIDCKH